MLMMGIDRAPNGDLSVTLQVARPHRQGIPSPGRSSNGSSQESPVVAVSEQGRDVGEALHKIQLRLDRTLFFGHLQALVIHRQVAEHGVLEVMNPLVQTRVISRNVWVFVSEPPTVEVLQQTPALDVIPGMYLSNFFRNRIWLNRPYDATIGGFHQRLVTPGIEPYALWITGVDTTLSAPTIGGLAAFSRDRMIGVMTGSRYTGWSLFENQFPRSKLAFSCPADPRKQFIVDVKSVRSLARVRGLEGPNPYVDVSVRIRGSVEGGPCVQKETSGELRTLQNQVERQTAQMIADAVSWSQSRLRSDVFGIGREVYRHDPYMWHGDDWWCRNQFVRLGIRVKVNARIDFAQTYHRSDLVYQRS